MFKKLLLLGCTLFFTSSLNSSVIDLTQKLFKTPDDKKLQAIWEKQCTVPFDIAQEAVKKVLKEGPNSIIHLPFVLERTSHNLIFIATCIEELKKKNKTRCIKRLRSILTLTCLCNKDIALLNFKTKKIFHPSHVPQLPQSKGSIIAVTKMLLEKPQNKKLKKTWEQECVIPFEQAQKIALTTLDGKKEELIELFTEYPFFPDLQIFLAACVDIMQDKIDNNQKKEDLDEAEKKRREKQTATLKVLEDVLTFQSGNCA